MTWIFCKLVTVHIFIFYRQKMPKNANSNACFILCLEDLQRIYFWNFKGKSFKFFSCCTHFILTCVMDVSLKNGMMIVARPHRHLVVTMRNFFKSVMALVQFLHLLFLVLIFQDFSTNWELQDDMVGTQAQFLQMREVSVENFMVSGNLYINVTATKYVHRIV